VREFLFALQVLYAVSEMCRMGLMYIFLLLKKMDDELRFLTLTTYNS
jgi:hypothetical protein